MDYGALPPEINSGRMYAGPGAESMMAAAAAWDGLSAELQSAASTYGSVISELTSAPWVGPSSAAMADAAEPYVAWMSATAGQAELAATQAKAAAAAYAAAFAATVPPAEIAANRAQLMTLVATNLFGQNTPGIAATEAQYGEMWAQDAAAMYGYAASSAATTAKVTQFTAAPQTTSTAGLATQVAAAAQTTGASTGTGVQSTLSQLMSTVQTALQNLASPLSSALSGSSGSSTILTPGGVLSTSGLSLGSILDGVITSYAAIPGWTALSLSSTVVGSTLGPLESSSMNLGFTPALVAANQAASAAGAAGAAAAPAAAGAAFGGGFPGAIPALGGFAGIGQAASVGGLSVPANWGWAATAPAGLVGAGQILSPAAVPLAGNEVAAGLGFPLPVGGLGRAAAASAGIGAVAAVAKYGPRLKFVPRPPAAGYGDEPGEPRQSATPKYPVPATFSTNGTNGHATNGHGTNGHAPPGYRAAVIYVPTNGAAPENP